MFQTCKTPDEMLAVAMDLLENGALLSALDELPAPVYVTDADGYITYFNPACIGFAGRTPSVGKDRWCVTWKLYTNAGEFLPHDECPMAIAIKSRRAIRGVTAVAERPDGTRVTFRPYATPLLSEEGELRGAVNILIDETEKQQAWELRTQAARCRRLADCVRGDPANGILLQMAQEYEQKAFELEWRVHKVVEPIDRPIAFYRQ